MLNCSNIVVVRFDVRSEAHFNVKFREGMMMSCITSYANWNTSHILSSGYEVFRSRIFVRDLNEIVDNSGGIIFRFSLTIELLRVAHGNKVRIFLVPHITNL